MSAEMITLERSQAGRATGRRIDGMWLFYRAMEEKPYIAPIIQTDNGLEIWNVEKQWWLKYKDRFSALGFLPSNAYNETKQTPVMLETF